MRRLLPIVLALCPCPWSIPARAHDIPNARVDRSIQATLLPGRLSIDYEVALSELTLTRELRMLVGALPGAEPRDWFVSYGRETGPMNARGFLVKVDGRQVDVRFVGFDLEVEEHPRYLFHFEVGIASDGHLSIQDTNFAASEGTSRLAIRGREGVTIRGDDLPPDVDSIPIRPVWLLGDAEERRTRQVAVIFSAPVPQTAARPGSPTELSSPTLPSPRPSSPAIAPRLGVTRLTRLIDRASSRSLWLLLAIAFGLGAVHAIQPGHGKTLVAATVLDERGTWMRGVLLAMATTLAHTGIVLLVALGLWWTQSSRYGEIHLGLTHLAGALIAAIGLWRLGRHLARYGEHDAEFEAEPAVTTPRRGLIGLGLAGGMVPCWDAVVLIVLAEATGRLAIGIVLLVAFGLGMASILVAVGVVAARVRRLVVRGRDRGPGGDSYGLWERRLGIASGLTLASIGVYLLGLS